MKKLLTDSRNRLLELMLQFLWRQWSALGVAGSTRASDDWLIDPEALLLVTTVFGRHEARLFDEVLDWLECNGRRINLQRLRNLDETWAIADRSVLATLADLLGDRSTLRKWNSLDLAEDKLTEVLPQALFRKADGTPMPVFGETDAVFLRHHLLRGPINLRGMSQPPAPNAPVTFLFKLRALFGVTARADIIAWLLSHESGHPAQIARQVGFFSKTAQLVLNELETSGHIYSRRSDREKHFWIRQEDWRFLITWKEAPSFPRWIDWAPIFSAITTLYSLLFQPGLDEQSPSLQSINLHKDLEKVFFSLSVAGLAQSLQVTSQLKGAELVESLVEDINRLLG